jgi:hypothetical protein
MKKSLFISGFLCLIAMLALTSCDEKFEEIAFDVPPKSFKNILLNPDHIYLYNHENLEEGVRLDPLVNDSIKVEVTISFSTPSFGAIQFIANEGWFYKPNANYYGQDNITYTVCYKNDCHTSNITLYVEEPFDPNTCTFDVQGESVTTSVDQPIAIRIFSNDVVCIYRGMSVFKPTYGNFNTYSYSGNYKNIVYVYYPPKGFKGVDQFIYKVNTGDGTIEATCTVTVE